MRNTGTFFTLILVVLVNLFLVSCNKPKAYLSRTDETARKLSLQLEASDRVYPENLTAAKSISPDEQVIHELPYKINVEPTPVWTNKNNYEKENQSIMPAQLKKSQKLARLLKKRPEIIGQAQILDNINVKTGIILMAVGVAAAIVLGIISASLAWIGAIVFIVGLGFLIWGILQKRSDNDLDIDL